jgi:hypothetical protein
MQYSTPAGSKERSMLHYLRDLQREAIADDKPLSFLQRKLRIGWGSLRVAVGMGIGNELYEAAKRLLGED